MRGCSLVNNRAGCLHTKDLTKPVLFIYKSIEVKIKFIDRGPCIPFELSMDFPCKFIWVGFPCQ